MSLNKETETKASTKKAHRCLNLVVCVCVCMCVCVCVCVCDLDWFCF